MTNHKAGRLKPFRRPETLPTSFSFLKISACFLFMQHICGMHKNLYKCSHANRSHLNLKLHAWLRYISYTRFEIYCLCFSFLLIHYKLLLLGLKAAISSQFQIGLILRRLLQNLSFLHNTIAQKLTISIPIHYFLSNINFWLSKRRRISKTAIFSYWINNDSCCLYI